VCLLGTQCRVSCLSVRFPSFLQEGGIVADSQVSLQEEAGKFSEKDKQLLVGALEFNQKEVGNIMTMDEDVFMLNLSQRLDFPTLANLLESGHSRIPVFDVTRNKVVGLLFVKDLALLNPEV